MSIMKKFSIAVLCVVITASSSESNADNRCDQRVPPAYLRTLRQWQIAPKPYMPKYREGYRDFTLHSIYHGDTVADFPYLPNGALDPRILFKYKRVFRDKTSGAMHSVHPRLVKLLYKLALTFKAGQINIVSGYRQGASRDSEKNHGLGRAADIIIPGVSINAVAVRARQLGHVGVGLYLNAGFVHIDVRDGPSYFWLDRSGPKKPSCHKAVLPEMISLYDNRWRAGLDNPRQAYHVSGRLLGELTVQERADILQRSKAAVGVNQPHNILLSDREPSQK